MKKSIAGITAAAALSLSLLFGAAAPAEASVPRAYSNALAQAKSYVRIMDFSKKGLYDQLHSPYGGKFSAKAAHYGADHVKANWNKEALGAAKAYDKIFHMSDTALYDQLVSPYGGKFTSSQAHWAINHL